MPAAVAPAIVLAASAPALPPGVGRWLEGLGGRLIRTENGDEVVATALRSRPRIIVLDARNSTEVAFGVLQRLKTDAYTAIIPTAVIVGGDGELATRAFAGGADEVLSPLCTDVEAVVRLEAVLRRSDRDLQAQATTGLPGPIAIDAEITRRIAAGTAFAACYADLDFFKEFNDRYSYDEGNRVIRVVALILHDVVGGLAGPDAFIGHIGGDDFIFVMPVPLVVPVCAEIIDVFDTLIPLQYSEQDRRAGYFFGKDRRGQLHRVSLMTISIGVVTTERRRFAHAAQVSTLATEMKSYAKTLPGSVFTIDRRQDEPADQMRLSGPIRLISPPVRDGGGA